MSSSLPQPLSTLIRQHRLIGWIHTLASSPRPNPPMPLLPSPRVASTPINTPRSPPSVVALLSSPCLSIPEEKRASDLSINRTPLLTPPPTPPFDQPYPGHSPPSPCLTPPRPASEQQLQQIAACGAACSASPHRLLFLTYRPTPPLDQVQATDFQLQTHRNSVPIY
jgi:hypothetical protein